jgi:HlyD family secretion protein
MDRVIKKKKWTTKRIGMIAFAVLFLSFVIYTFLLADNRSKLNVDTEKLTVSTVDHGTFQEYIPVTGTVMPSKTYYIDVVEGGIIKAIKTESGAMVERGKVILELSNSNLELNVLDRQTNLYEQLSLTATTRLSLDQNDLDQQRQIAEINYRLQLLEPQVQRLKNLYKKELVSKRELEEVEEEYLYNKKRKKILSESYQKDSLSRAIQLRQLGRRETMMMKSLNGVNGILDNLIVKAPMKGLLTMIPDLEIGQSINQGESIGQVDVVGSYKARVRIDELYLPRIDTGQIGTFQFDNNTYTLKITKIYPNITEGRFEVDMEFVSEQPAGIKRGQSLRIRLELSKSQEALLLSMGGFYQDTGGNWVYVLKDNGNKAVKRDIRLGRKNNENFEVLEGLQPGEKVITSSYEHFGDNEVLLLN